MTRQLLRKKRNVVELQHELNDASQSTFVFKKLLSRRFINVDDFQFDDELIDFKLKDDEKNVNCLIDDNVQKTCRENIFHSDANSMLQRTKELTIIICFLISSFDVQIINRKKDLQS